MLSTIGHIVVRCVWVSSPVVASSRALAFAVAWAYCRRWLVVWRSSRSHWEHCAVHQPSLQSVIMMGFQGNRPYKAASSRDTQGSFRPSSSSLLQPQATASSSRLSIQQSLCPAGSAAPHSQTGDEQRNTENKCLMTHTIHPVSCSYCLSLLLFKDAEQGKEITLGNVWQN